MLGIKDLKKVHRQKPSRSLRRLYRKKRSNEYLNLSCSNWDDFLKIDLFEKSMANKTFIESAVNRFMQKYWDVWEIMTFEERNHLFLVEYDESFKARKQFKWKQGPIMIVFFPPALNRIYIQEPLVLEYDQYFRLYRDFSDQIIDMDAYKHLPYEANMTSAEWVMGDEASFVLYWEEYRLFLLYEDLILKEELPLDLKTENLNLKQKESIAKRLLEADESELIDYLLQENLCHRRFVKRYERKMRRKKK